MIRIRPCEGFEEFDACVQLEVETWGYDESELIPRKTFLLAQKIGGQVIGAFEGDDEAGNRGNGIGTEISTKGAGKSTENLVGFAMSLPGVKTENGRAEPYLHSHMLAVGEGWRNRGIGGQLKRSQRDDALARGIRRIEWTFDPLEIKNAFLNIHRLGAKARTYCPDFYGVSSSRLQGGLPTDRLVAEWELDSPRVRAALEGRPAAVNIIEERILVPASIYQWKASHADRERALAVQMENRRRFQQAFSQGLVVLGFSLDAEGNGAFELGSLTRPKQVFHTEDRENL
jgi:predicted GNAT superfamily acetyltransferase